MSHVNTSHVCMCLGVFCGVFNTHLTIFGYLLNLTKAMFLMFSGQYDSYLIISVLGQLMTSAVYERLLSE